MLLYIIWYPPSPMESRLNNVTDLCMFCSCFWCLEQCLAHGRTSINICWVNEWAIEWMLLVPLITQDYSRLWASLAQKLHLTPFYITRLSLSIWLKAQWWCDSCKLAHCIVLKFCWSPELSSSEATNGSSSQWQGTLFLISFKGLPSQPQRVWSVTERGEDVGPAPCPAPNPGCP